MNILDPVIRILTLALYFQKYKFINPFLKIYFLTNEIIQVNAKENIDYFSFM